MRYLATIGSKPLWGNQDLYLHCREIDKLTWLPVKEKVVIELVHKFQPGALVIAHITVANNRLQRIEEATEAIVVTLHGFSTISRRYKDLSHDIEAWKASMQIQLEELHRREEALMQRAEELKLELVCTIPDSHNRLTIPLSLEAYERSEMEETAKV